VPVDGNDTEDVFLVDRDTGDIERVSVYNTKSSSRMAPGGRSRSRSA
jgi:hypothetical protein